MHNKTPNEIDTHIGKHKRLHRGQKITIIELGYWSDTRFIEKVAEKTEQHTKLVATLKDLGYVTQVYHVPLGHTGAVYTPLGHLLNDCEVKAESGKQLSNKLVAQAVEYAHAAVTTRRRLESFVTVDETQAKGNCWRKRKR